MRKKIIWGLAGLIILIIAFYLLYPAFNVKELDDANPLGIEMAEGAIEGIATGEETPIMLQGDFIAQAHDVEGKAVIIESGGKKILRFEDFDTINGPDLRIYLSNDLDVDDSIDLGPIKGTKGNINYELPPDADLEKYDKVLVWCRAFRVLFSYADLE